jgi:hypothetical protein
LFPPQAAPHGHTANRIATAPRNNSCVSKFQPGGPKWMGNMFWLFNKTGVMTVLGALLLILAIYLLRVNMASPPDKYRPDQAASTDHRWPPSP